MTFLSKFHEFQYGMFGWEKAAKVTARSLIILTSCFFFWPSSTQSQPSLQKALLDDSVTVSVSNISIDNEFSLRGLTADFPYPVLSTISVVDSRGNPIIGLADTSRWLGPEDVAQIGLPISAIWQPILEYHRDDPAFPPDPNVFSQSPPPLFTEVLKSSFLPTSTMLVMDVSGSMVEEIDDTKTGARLFVDLLEAPYQVGIAQFADSVTAFLPLTDDKEKIGSFIDSTQIGGFTALFDGIMAGIQEVKFAAGRRGVIVYTDGRDNRSTITVGAVIDSARAYNLPVFTIALGNETREANLKRIASETGGLFFKAATSEEMIVIYRKLAGLIQNFYIMAHTSPDPIRNNTWRMLDISVNAANYRGRGAGQYFVEGPPAPTSADLAVTFTSLTDTTVVEGAKTFNAVQPGESYEYQINLKNLGQGKSDTVKLFHFLPDSVGFISATPSPAFADDDLSVWQFENFAAGTDTSILVSVQLGASLPPDLFQLTSSVNVNAENDTVLDNNTAFDTVRVLFARPPVKKNFDLALSQTVATDTTIVLNGETVQAVRRGESYPYSLRIENLGPEIARDFTLFNVIPDSVTVSNFSLAPNTQVQKTLFWNFDSLNPGAALTINFEAQASELLYDFPFELLNVAEIFAEKDTNSVNDSTATKVYAVARPGDEKRQTDLSVTQMAFVDSFAVVGADSVKVVREGEMYSYVITVSNDRPVAARNVTVSNQLPGLVTADGFEPVPDLANDDLLRWLFDVIPPLSFRKLKFDATVASDAPVGKNLLINNVMVTADNEDPNLLANNTSVDTVFNFVRPAGDLLPLIEARPPQVDVGDTVSARVQVRVPNESWDLRVIFASGQIDSTYADAYIAQTELVPNQWFDVQPLFTNTRLFTDAEQEQIVFELRTVDIFGDLRTARANVTVQSNNNLVLDRNVFVASKDDFMDIRFKLSSNRLARLDLFDVTGAHIAQLSEAQYNAGWNTFQWNGKTKTGEKVGSGLYLVTLRSGGFNSMKKVMVVR